jgi:hypothetical protein
MLNEIQMVYGFLDEETKKWVEEKTRYLTEEQKQVFLDTLKKEYPAKKGIPDKESLQRVLTKVTGKAPTVYFWAVCMECGCEYDFSLPKCPDCYHKNLLCSVRSVRTSMEKPPAKVIRYNKPCGENNCYDCQNTELSFCYHFGKTDWQCHNLSNCPCASCCVKEKRENEKIEARRKSGVTFKYAVPIKKGV